MDLVLLVLVLAALGGVALVSARRRKERDAEPARGARSLR